MSSARAARSGVLQDGPAAVQPLPCPFCGAEAMHIEWVQESSVYCGNHHCFSRPKATQMNLSKAINAWNRRSHSAPQASLLSQQTPTMVASDRAPVAPVPDGGVGAGTLSADIVERLNARNRSAGREVAQPDELADAAALEIVRLRRALADAAGRFGLALSAGVDWLTTTDGQHMVSMSVGLAEAQGALDHKAEGLSEGPPDREAGGTT